MPKEELYKHFKGTLYRVLGTATHTETGEVLVIYQNAQVDNGELWVRPYEMFHGMHESGVKRFMKVEEESGS